MEVEGQLAVFIIEPKEIDKAGIRVRNDGYEIRDCFYIARAIEEPPLLGILARKKLKGSLTDAFLRDGVGAIDIDSNRIPTDKWDQEAMQRVNSPGSGRFKKGMPPIGTFERNTPHEPLDVTKGRFPSNFILMHSSRCEGTSCVAQCPVTVMDRQSGMLTSGKVSPQTMQNRSQNESGGGYSGGWGDVPLDVFYGDTGGASRFYQKVKDIDDLIQYFYSLSIPVVVYQGHGSGHGHGQGQFHEQEREDT